MANQYTNKPEITAKEVRTRQPMLTQSWDFNNKFDEVFNDGHTNKGLLVRREETAKRYNRT